jgi:hypothetical protein
MESMGIFWVEADLKLVWILRPIWMHIYKYCSVENCPAVFVRHTCQRGSSQQIEYTQQNVKRMHHSMLFDSLQGSTINQTFSSLDSIVNIWLITDYQNPWDSNINNGLLFFSWINQYRSTSFTNE